MNKLNNKNEIIKPQNYTDIISSNACCFATFVISPFEILAISSITSSLLSFF